ncbi:hypothetical protein AKUH3B209X_PPKS00050 (plasmid) [Apilactobacillus kunkeei]|nr:hypothetical protein AKUH4B403J_PPKS00050 [Apilactobacillus kunkeei]CAI2672006.1 hypothetical protein AKUH4B103J_PPKS00050 [Apilactobacillus kunkeei]CAI2672868.1 hypothetical protein AKUH4B203M_PPKS00050 [Apilactobacillus kunkeei]CAI2674415.1 hypothetical protein AKUH4B116J_PPKS00050 [Apilactobacillus kunkeei]CAI2674763.1 hypothetical protein AKUH4B303J_PPKS00050 [Apilactobacillus kunkeei]
MKNNYKLRKVSIKLIGAMALLIALLATPIVNHVTVSASSFHYQIKKSGYVYKNANIKAIKSHSAKHYFGSHKLTVKKTIVVKRHGKKLVYKYVLASNGRNGWVNTKYVKKVKTAKHNKVSKTHKKGQYVPNKENIKAEFKKLLDPYLAKYGKTYGVTNGDSIKPLTDRSGYGSEFVVTSGNYVSSDKEIAKVLFNGLLNGTLMSYLKDNSNVSVVVDHIDIDNSYGTTDARLYLTWYWDISK